MVITFYELIYQFNLTTVKMCDEDKSKPSGLSHLSSSNDQDLERHVRGSSRIFNKLTSRV